MNILITTQDLQGLAGSKFAAYDVGVELAKAGHAITLGCIGEFIGPMAQHVQATAPNIRLASLSQLRDSGERFDVGIVSPYATLQFAMPMCERIVYWSQGIVNEERMPHPDDFAPHSICAITAEVAEHWLADLPEVGGVSLVPTPIRIPGLAIPSGPVVKKVTHFSNYDDIPGLRESCESRGITFCRLCHADRATINNELNNTDLVVSVGRGCYEAMALGKEVAICDFRDYMGAPWSDGLASLNYPWAQASNCSGRWAKTVFEDSLFENWLGLYDAARAFGVNRARIMTYHDSTMIANTLLRQAN